VGHSESRFYRRLRYAYLRLWKSGFSSLKYPTPNGYFVMNFDAVALIFTRQANKPILGAVTTRVKGKR
jgi:hypothetical protein